MKTGIKLFLCIAMLLCACHTANRPQTLPRPAPGYAHWLEKQSMLSQAPALIAQVSQSERIWLQGADPGRSLVLLENAPSWLDSRDSFSSLASLAAHLPKVGIRGIYLGQTGERPDIWLSASAAVQETNPASLEFNPESGTEKDFERLAQAAEAAGIEIGASLIAGYTGRGPDFALQARKVTGHAGLYAMLPVPADAASLLYDPDSGEWSSHKLEPAEVEALISAGVLPRSIARDNLAWASPGGWAVTGPVTGADGMARRWLYRYAYIPEQPVMAWQDPSGQASKVFSAAVIRQTGLLGMSLSGIHMEPLLGLEPGGGSGALSPGLDAINSIARQIHRYGGWAMQADPVPVHVMAEILKGPCDFCRDDITEMLVIFGLLRADGRPLAHLYRQWLKNSEDTARHARGLGKTVNPLLLPGDEIFSLARNTLTEYKKGDTIKYQLADQPGLSEAISAFILAWRLGLPGLAFFDAPDMPGLAPLLNARAKTGLGAGKVVSVTRGKGGGFGLLSSLPTGGFWLLICNFGVNPDEMVITLPVPVHRASLAGGGDLTANLQTNAFHMGIKGRAVKHVILN